MKATQTTEVVVKMPLKENCESALITLLHLAQKGYIVGLVLEDTSVLTFYMRKVEQVDA